MSSGTTIQSMQSPLKPSAGATFAVATTTVVLDTHEKKQVELEPNDAEDVDDETFLTLQRLLQTFNSVRPPIQSEAERRRAQREDQRRSLFEGFTDRSHRMTNRSAAERRIRSRVWSTTCSLPPVDSITRDRWTSTADESADKDELYALIPPAVLRSSFRPPTCHPKLEVVLTSDHKALRASLLPRRVSSPLPSSQGAKSRNMLLLKPPKSTWYLKGKNIKDKIVT
ncbi:hypothetical protein DYB37_013419 [Aphanomyces astaci]|uniref:Uncharacterized protein n=1 Tax=Aphanomyces astaci TaxID=112090 RepID=A0A418EUI3_APHAT|nr:hypothetical protein DYB37_013419 [Aphanomyces astaci]